MPKSSKFSRKTNNLIASLRGLPRDRSRAFWKDEKDLDSVMDRVIQKFHITEARPEEAILADWISIVGDRNASHSHPHRLDHGFRLYVLVSNPVIKQEMQFHNKMILDRLKRIPGCESIREIVFRAG
jgi:hypothetical protein